MGSEDRSRPFAREAVRRGRRSPGRHVRAGVAVAVLLPLVVAGVLSAHSRAGSAAHAPASAARTHADSPAAVPPVPSGDVARFRMTVEDRTIQIAPGVRYRAWTFNGAAPGPVLHVRQGQTVEITFRNRGSIAHSFDLHAARIRPDVAFKDVAPGESLTFRFVADNPGVFLYHCVTAPAVAHIANGMYGAMIVDPERPLPAADAEFVLVASEWYLDRAGDRRPAQMSISKALAATPDWMTFNGSARRYADQAFHVEPGWRVRFYVANAGPNLATPFHVVGGIFDRVYSDGDVTHWLTGVQTANVPPGGGAIFDARFDEPGVYGFVSHMFASADKGEIGAITVGTVHGSMQH